MWLELTTPKAGKSICQKEYDVLSLLSDIMKQMAAVNESVVDIRASISV